MIKSKSAARAFTLLEVLVVILILIVLVAMLLPAMTGGGPSQKTYCINNLRQIELGFMLWNSDNMNRWPMQVSTNEGGTMELEASGSATVQFKVLSSILPNPRLFLCPTETKRKAVTNYSGLTDANLSYFINLDPSTNLVSSSIAFFTGDRHLEADGKAVKPGLFVLTTNKMSWTTELHPKGPSGNMGFMDGHVEVVKGAKLPAIMTAGSGTNRLAVP